MWLSDLSGRFGGAELSGRVGHLWQMVVNENNEKSLELRTDRDFNYKHLV